MSHACYELSAVFTGIHKPMTGKGST